MSWSKAREGTRADPLTPPQERAGDRPPPPPLSSRPSLPQRGAEITPSPRGSDLGTWAGFRARPPALGFSTAFPPGSQFCTPNKVPRPQARAGKAVAAVLSGAGREDATCLCPRRGGRRGPFGSPPGHSLAETSPFGSPGSAHAPTPRLSSLPLSRGHLGPEPRVPPGHWDLIQQLNPGCEPPFLPGESRNLISCDSSFPIATPRVPSLLVPRSQGPSVLDSRRRGGLPRLEQERPRPPT